METTLTLNLEIKKDIARELIRSKNEQLHLLLREQKEKLDNANQEDIDKGDLESPKQQMMDEIELQASRLDHLSADTLKRLHLVDSFVNKLQHGGVSTKYLQRDGDNWQKEVVR